MVGRQAKRASGRVVVGPAAIAVAAAAMVAGCGGGSSGGSAAPTTVATSPSAAGTATASGAGTPTGTSSPTSSATATASATVEAALADGRYAARVTSIDSAKRFVTVDVVQWFTGPQAVKAAAEDHAPPPEDDYYIRNTSHRLRTLPVATAATITTNVLSAEETGSSTKTVPRTLAQVASYHYGDALFWMTLKAGVVKALTEQYLP